MKGNLPIDFYSLKRLSEEWDCTIEDLKHLIFDKKLIRLSFPSRKHMELFFWNELSSPFQLEKISPEAFQSLSTFVKNHPLIEVDHDYENLIISGESIVADGIDQRLGDFTNINALNSYNLCSIHAKCGNSFSLSHIGNDCDYSENLYFNLNDSLILDSIGADGYREPILLNCQDFNHNRYVFRFVDKREVHGEGIFDIISAPFHQSPMFIEEHILSDSDKLGVSRQEKERVEGILYKKPKNKGGNSTLPIKERNSLLKLVIGMAIAKYNYNPASSRNTATGINSGSIHADLASLGINMDNDTIRKYLNEGKSLISAGEMEE